MVAIDGPSGSGKTTLARAIAEIASVQLVHMDDLYPGWAGMRAAGATVARLLQDLGAGRVGTYRRYDWHEQKSAEAREVHPRGIVVVEGVGSVRAEYLDRLSVVVLACEPDADERLRRALQRDGPEIEPQLREWMAEEASLHAEVGLRALAHVTVNGRGELAP